MNKSFLSFLVLPVLLAAFPVGAQQKIATIDLKRVFDEFYKTKIADSQIKDEAADITKGLKEMDEARQKMIGEYKTALEESQSQALSEPERDKRKKAAENKLVEINALEQQFKAQQRAADATLGERQTKARDKILKEIQAVVNAQAKAGGYSLVLDAAGEGMSRTSIVFYTNGADDLTPAVIKELNAKAPADLPKLDKPAPKLNGVK